ncbi:coproporphyrinogen-III oxidase family protein [Paraburkholderia domus]|uniref:coproporphyrinogen-III oxidase family protein n=1 Tax=Paraburkholderia domus TaxID=2793075 RepID=UPI001B00F3A0|nr:radical SAM protein [Paraburkholderia domus]CAE6851423.1 hypothetical protein R75483_07618 [Paraburkholderia domus]
MRALHDDEIRRILSLRYAERKRPIGFYPLPSTHVAPGEFLTHWKPYRQDKTRVGLVYLHVPFCRQRCGFCRFYPGVHSDERSHQFVDAARREIDLWAGRRALDPSSGPVQAVFIGGGTPSALTARQIETVLRHLADAFVLAADAEITMEWYPKDAVTEKLSAARENGVDRLSLGIQSWNPRVLEFLGAHHSPADADAVLAAAAAAGHDNINIDIMADVSVHAVDDHIDDLRRAIAAGVSMIAVNPLELAAAAPLSRRRSEANGDEKRQWLTAASTYLLEEKYEHQRVRNYFRDGRYHRYNRATTGVLFDIVPVGPGAYGFVGGWPVINAIGFDEWRGRLSEGGDAVTGCAPPSDDEMRRAFVVNSLLELEIDGVGYQQLFGSSIVDDFPVLSELIAHGCLLEHGARLVLHSVATEFGDDISTELFSDFQRSAFDAHLSIGRTRQRSQYFPVAKS